MIEKFAIAGREVQSEFRDLNHAHNPMTLVSPMIPKFAPEPGIELGRTSESGH